MDNPVSTTTSLPEESSSLQPRIEDLISCPICLDELESSLFEPFTNCSHSLCKECYSHFSETSNRCPVCRANIRDEKEIIDKALALLHKNLTSINKELNRLKIINTRARFSSTRDADPADLQIVRDALKGTVSLALETGLIPPNTPVPEQRNIPTPTPLPQHAVDFNMRIRDNVDGELAAAELVNVLGAMAPPATLNIRGAPFGYADPHRAMNYPYALPHMQPFGALQNILSRPRPSAAPAQPSANAQLMEQMRGILAALGTSFNNDNRGGGDNGQ